MKTQVEYVISTKIRPCNSTKKLNLIKTKLTCWRLDQMARPIKTWFTWLDSPDCLELKSTRRMSKSIQILSFQLSQLSLIWPISDLNINKESSVWGGPILGIQMSPTEDQWPMVSKDDPEPHKWMIFYLIQTKKRNNHELDWLGFKLFNFEPTVICHGACKSNF